MFPPGTLAFVPSELCRQGVHECDEDGVPKPVKTCMAYARVIGVNAAEEAACLNDRMGCDGQGYFELADNHNFQVDSASEVVDCHTIKFKALRAENMTLQGSIADCIIQIEDLRMSLRLLAERQVGRAPVIDFMAEEELVVGNEVNVVPVPVPAPFVLPVIAPEYVLVPVEELGDLDEETVVEGALDSV